MFSNDVFFEPWIGKNYGTKQSIFPVKILVLGDSHYCDDCEDCGDREKHLGCVNFTQKVVSDYLNTEHTADWKRTYSKFINSIYGKQSTLQERIDFFDSVCFYNYLQVSAGNNPYATSLYDYSNERHLKAFVSVLDNLEPDIVIAWGTRIWDIIPQNIGYGNLTNLKTGKISSCVYPIANKKILFIDVCHPASTHFKQDLFTKYLKDNNILLNKSTLSQ